MTHLPAHERPPISDEQVAYADERFRRGELSDWLRAAMLLAIYVVACTLDAEGK